MKYCYELQYSAESVFFMIMINGMINMFFTTKSVAFLFNKLSGSLDY